MFLTSVCFLMLFFYLFEPVVLAQAQYQEQVPFPGEFILRILSCAVEAQHICC